MTDPGVFKQPRPLDYDEYWPWPRIGMAVRRPRMPDERVHIVTEAAKPWDWRRGEWVRVTTACGLGFKHHGERRNLITDAPVSCIECLASGTGAQ